MEMIAPAHDRAAVGAILSRARHGAGYTQRQLAAISGVKQGTISRIERGAVHAPMTMIAQLADALGLDLMVEARPRF